MKTALIYVSKHHQNTKKLLDEISKLNDVDVFSVNDVATINFNNYSRIGFASGVYMGGVDKQILKIIDDNKQVLQCKKIFGILTSGSNNIKYVEKLQQTFVEFGLDCIGIFNCKGYDTFGPFALVGGVSKGHPDEEDIKNAVDFYKKLDGAT